jgi:hypothetical protein
METYTFIILTLELDGGEWSASRPDRFSPGTQWTGSWVGPGTGLAAVVNGIPCRESNSDSLFLFFSSQALWTYQCIIN